MVNFLLALSECDGRRLWADLGYASLFDYLHRELGLSKSAAFFRVAAASLVQRYPAVADALADGLLCLSTVGELGKVITPENARQVLPRFFHLSAREARVLVAEIAPHPAPPLREVVTLVRDGHSAAVVRSAALSDAVRVDEPQNVLTSGQTATPATAAPAMVRAAAAFDSGADAARPSEAVRREEVEPLTADLRRFHVTVSKRWMDKLSSAKAALSHAIPSGSAEEVLEAALDALLEREAKRKGLVKNPRKPRASTAESSSPAQPDSNSPKRRRKKVPAHVQREVLIRDQAKCQAKLHDGTICGSTVRLQLDHVQPDSLGGPTTVENVRVLCASHNQLAARNVFGDQLIDLFTRNARK